MRKLWKTGIAVMAASVMILDSTSGIAITAKGTKTSSTPSVAASTVSTDSGATATTENISYQTRDAFYSLTDSSVNRATSEHFQIIWGNGDTTGTVTQSFVEGNLENLENIWTFYVEVLGMKNPGQSHNTSVYGTGYYKTNLYISNTGLSNVEDDWAYMSVDSDDFGYMVMMPGAMRVDDTPSWVIPHEFAHVITYHAGGVVEDGWYEAMANWYRDQFLGSEYYKHGNNVYGPDSDFFSPVVLNSDYYFPHLKNYYDCWPLLLYISENPDNIDGLGMSLMRKIVSDSTDESMFERIERLSGVSIKEVLGYYSRRMVTMDFTRQSKYLNYLDDLLDESGNYDKIYTTLTDQNGWLTVSSDRAPMQGGYNIVPLNVDLSKASVTVNFQGTSTASDADYRVSIVSKTADNTTRYSTLWSNGENTLNLQGDETKVYLVVCATPDEMQDLEVFNLDAVGTRYGYKIQVSTSDTAATVTPSESITPSESMEPSESIAPSESVAPVTSETPSQSVEPSVSVKPSQTVEVSPSVSSDVESSQALPALQVTTSISSSVTQTYKLSAVGEGNMDISKVKIRYYYNASNKANEQFWCDYAGLSLTRDPWYVNYAESIQGTFTDEYMEISFLDSYELSENNGCLSFSARFNNGDWSAYQDFEAGTVVVYYDGTALS